MANGILATFQSNVTTYLNDNARTLNPAGLTRADFPIYTCPAGFLTSGTLRVSNTTGSSITVDLAVKQYSEAIKLVAAGSQGVTVNPSVPYPISYQDFTIPTNTDTTSFHVDGTVWNSTNFTVGETVTWTNATLGVSGSAKVVYWDSGSPKRLWLTNLVAPESLTLSLTLTGQSSGGTLSINTIVVGPWGTVSYFDKRTGTILFHNKTLKNNIDFTNILGTAAQQRVINGVSSNISLTHRELEWLPAGATVTTYNSANPSGTPTTAEYIGAYTGGGQSPVYYALDVASVSYAEPETYIAKSLSVSNNSTLEVTGLVLEPLQTLHVNSSGNAVFNLVGFEESL